jgi:hypothetical protein
MVEDMIMAAVDMAVDGICATLLTAYREGLPAEASFRTPLLGELAGILNDAREHARSVDSSSDSV